MMGFYGMLEILGQQKDEYPPDDPKGCIITGVRQWVTETYPEARVVSIEPPITVSPVLLFMGSQQQQQHMFALEEQDFEHPDKAVESICQRLQHLLGDTNN